MVDVLDTTGDDVDLGSTDPADDIVDDLGDTEELPRKLGRCTLTERIGAGGMARIYLAVQDGAAGFTKTVVVKQILPQLSADKSFVQMFLREARLAAALQHANIVQVLELGQEDGTYYMVMEHVDGMTLQRLATTSWAAGKPLPMELIVAAVADAALGLHYAHTRPDAKGGVAGVVHRDISPDNLMIGTSALTKIVDFGIARPIAADTSMSLTRTGTLKGKIPFLAPEQIEGKPIDGRADLYALGVTMYWLLTGQRPFTGKTDFEVMSNILHQKPTLPSTLNANVPAGLDDIVIRLLDKNRDQRLGGADVLHEALVPFLTSPRTRFAAYLEEMMTRARGAPARPAQIGIAAAVPETLARGVWAPSSSRGGETTVDERLPLLSTTDPSNAAITPASPHLLDVTLHESLAPARPTLRRAAIAGAVGAAVLALVAVVVRASVDDPSAPPPIVVAPSPPVATPAPIVAPPPPVATPPPAIATSPPIAATEDDDAATAKETKPAVVETHHVAVARTMTVAAKASSEIVWVSSSGATLGKGTCSLTLPADAKSVVALDTRRQMRVTVPINQHSVDYASLPHGKIDVRVYPYANVFIGKEAFGATPIDPIDVVAGDYEVTLVGRDGKRVKAPVTVTAHKTALLKIDLTR